MSRMVLAVMAGLLCALLGFRHAAAIKGDATRLQRWLQVLRHMELLLQEGTMSIPEALCTVAEENHPPDRLLRDMAGRMAASPMTTAREAFDRCGFTASERDVLARMFTRLGHGTKDSRCLALIQAAKEMELLSEAASAKALKDAKLWNTLGLTGGICLTLLLL